jgi:tetratricopeptide (TPR) repeat protein
MRLLIKCPYLKRNHRSRLLRPKFLLYGGLTLLVLLTIWGVRYWGVQIALIIPIVSVMLWFGLIVLFCLLGDLDAARGNYAGALRCYSQAEGMYCRRAQLYCNRGKIFYRTGDSTKAANDFGRSLQLDPRQAEAYLGRGAILMATGQNTAALSDYDRAIDYQSDFAEAHHSRGIIQLRLGDLTAAQVNFQRAIELKPDFFHPHYYLGLVQIQLGNLAAAQKIIDQSITLRPQYPPLYYVQGKLAILQQEGQSADTQAAIAAAQHSFTMGQDWETKEGVDRYKNDEYGHFYRGWAAHYQPNQDIDGSNDWLQAQNLATLHQNKLLLAQINILLEKYFPTTLN